jgi:HEAT repeat protein
MNNPLHLGAGNEEKSAAQRNAGRVQDCATRTNILLVWLFGMCVIGCGGPKPVGERESAYSVEELQERLHDADPEVRFGAAQGLRQQGNRSAAAIKDLIVAANEDVEVRVRQSAVQALGAMGPDSAAALPTLMKLLQRDPDEIVRRNAAVALGKLGSAARSAVPALQQAARTGAPIIRRAAQEALEQLQISGSKK